MGSTRRTVLIAAILASSMAYIDSTALVVAQTKMYADRFADATAVQWVSVGYLLFLSALIMVGGALGDRYGRRRFFELGTWIFVASSVVCALAPNVAILIAARCVQGAGAAAMIPESLALITSVYDERTRGRAIGIWSAAAAIVMVAGPLLGGYLPWRWIFLINVPLAAVVIVLCRRGVPESRAPGEKAAPDIAGSLSLTLGLALIVFPLIEIQARLAQGGATWWLLSALPAGVALVVAFVAIERRAPSPIAPLQLFSDRTFAVTNVYTFLLYASLGGALFFVPFELRNVWCYSPLQTGAALLPTIGCIAALAPLTGALAARTGTRNSLVAGAAVATIGYALLARLGVVASCENGTGEYLRFVLPATLVLGIGLVIVIPPLITAVMSSAGPQNAGAASGINNAISRIGNVVAIALCGIVITLASGHAIPSSQHPEGFAYAMLFAGALTLAAGLIALRLPSAGAWARRG